MNKIITQEQINAVLNTIYQNSDISARNYDSIKLFLAQLPIVPGPDTVKPN